MVVCDEQPCHLHQYHPGAKEHETNSTRQKCKTLFKEKDRDIEWNSFTRFPWNGTTMRCSEVSLANYQLTFITFYNLTSKWDAPFSVVWKARHEIELCRVYPACGCSAAFFLPTILLRVCISRFNFYRLSLCEFWTISSRGQILELQGEAQMRFFLMPKPRRNCINIPFQILGCPKFIPNH